MKDFVSFEPQFSSSSPFKFDSQVFEYLMKPKRALTSAQGKICRSFAQSKVPRSWSLEVSTNATSAFSGDQ